VHYLAQEAYPHAECILLVCDDKLSHRGPARRRDLHYNLLKRHSHGRRQEEIHYFHTPTFRRGVDWYRIHFPHQQQRNGQRVITGEASPNYLFYPHTTRRVAETIPQTKLAF
jgi:hypothetical protein